MDEGSRNEWAGHKFQDEHRAYFEDYIKLEMALCQR